MSLLRALAMTLLLIALLPWGAHLRPAPTLQATAVVAAETASPHRPGDLALKCRKGLAGSSCTAEKALAGQSPAPPAATGGGHRPLAAARALPKGLSPRPGLPPPRLS